MLSALLQYMVVLMKMTMMIMRQEQVLPPAATRWHTLCSASVCLPQAS